MKETWQRPKQGDKGVRVQFPSCKVCSWAITMSAADAKKPSGQGRPGLITQERDCGKGEECPAFKELQAALNPLLAKD